MLSSLIRPLPFLAVASWEGTLAARSESLSSEGEALVSFFKLQGDSVDNDFAASIEHAHF